MTPSPQPEPRVREWRRLPASRLTPAGGRGADAASWAGRAAAVALLLSAVWLIFSAVRPLPRPEVGGASAISPVAPRAPAVPTIEERQQRLAALTSTNIFAPDRAMWRLDPPPRTAADASALADGSSGGAAEGAGAESAVPDRAASDPWSAPLADPGKIGTAVAAKLKEVQFRGVYVLDGEPRVLVGVPSDAGRARVYAVGDTFDDGAWKVLAIDHVGDRMLLSRAGQNFEFRLYDDGSASRAGDQPPSTDSEPAGDAVAASPAPSALPGPPIVSNRSADDVRAELAKAGVDQKDIDELLRIAGEIPIDTIAASPESAPRDGASPAQGEAAEPVGLGAILQMMKVNPLGAEAERAPPKESRHPRDRRKKQSRQSAGDGG